MESGKVHDCQITSSSFWEGFSPEKGRLNSASSWSSNRNDDKQWIQVDLSKEKEITAIATQGRKHAAQWVETYAVSYSLDGRTYERYTVDGVEMVRKRTVTQRKPA